MAKPRQRDHLSAPATGGISLLTVFAVLALTVFALLSLSTVRADERLSLASAQAVRDYYAADNGAQEILARRGRSLWMSPSTAGSIPTPSPSRRIRSFRWNFGWRGVSIPF